jgi:hypothetical protein
MGSGWFPVDCCAGLTMIDCAEPGPGGSCMAMSDCFYCSYCGDGSCGPGENYCNCTDC